MKQSCDQLISGLDPLVHSIQKIPSLGISFEGDFSENGGNTPSPLLERWYVYPYMGNN